MKNIILIFLISVQITYSQKDEEKEKEKIRRDKIETILKIQDLRSVSDGKLISYLSDPDSIIREKATLAYGSLQDTSVLHLLIRNLTDSAVTVQTASAFAIGQTGSLLSSSGRRRLEDELIWKKLGHTKVDEMLIEEIGKFGTEEALNQLMLRYGTLYPRVFTKGLSMAIARFALRGVYNKDAINYLLSFIKPNASLDWRIMYALMRISAIQQTHKDILQEINNIATFYRYGDPVVRMHLATILGRLKNENYGLEPLVKMAEFDRDWRVRINALKALSNFDIKKNERVLSVFKRAIYDDNMHIALTALSELGRTGIREDDSLPIINEIFDILKRILKNPDNVYLWQYQANAAITLAKLMKENAYDLIYENFNSNDYLKKAFIEALSITKSKKAINKLLENVKNSNSLIATASLEGIHQICIEYRNDKELIEKVYQELIACLGHRHQSVIATSSIILRDTIFLNKKSVKPLIKTLDKLRVPDDTDAILEIIRTLEALKDRDAIPVLKKHLSTPERSIAITALKALNEITGKDYSSDLQLHLQPIYVDYDFNYLYKISRKPIVNIETIRGIIKIELFPDVAPFTVMSFLKLAEKGFFKGTFFHRVVPNFVIQGGDPEGSGWGGPGYTLRSEFSQISFDAGYVGMASSGKDTEGSQFFITHSPQPHLDGKYTLFGKVISGMDVVNKIQSDDRIFDIKLEE